MAYIQSLSEGSDNILLRVKATGLKLRVVAEGLGMNPSLLNHHLKRARGPFAEKLSAELRRRCSDIQRLADDLDHCKKD
jgi:hypothetical protein